MRASARSFGKSARHMDIVQLRGHHLRRARTHPLILSTMLPAEAMPPSGRSLIWSKEPVASVAASASVSSPRAANGFLVLVMYGSSSAGELISPMISFSSASAKMGSFSGITFSSASTEVGDARNLAERSEHTSGQRHLGVLGPTLGLLVSWVPRFLGLAAHGARTRTRSPRASSCSPCSPCSSHASRPCT